MPYTTYTRNDCRRVAKDADADITSVERDGIIERYVYPVVPLKVEYSLTPLGKTITELLKEICKWAEVHFDELEQARAYYDQRIQP